MFPLGAGRRGAPGTLGGGFFCGGGQCLGHEVNGFEDVRGRAADEIHVCYRPVCDVTDAVRAGVQSEHSGNNVGHGLGFCLVLATGPNPAGLGAGVLIFAGAIALTAPALVARIVEVAPPGETAGATAWYGAFMFLGGSAGPVLAATVRGSGLGSAIGLVIAVTAAGAVLITATRKDSQGAVRPA